MQEFTIELEGLTKKLSSLAAQNKRRSIESAQILTKIATLYNSNKLPDLAVENCGKCLDILDDMVCDGKMEIQVELYLQWAKALITLAKFAEAQTKAYNALLIQLGADKRDTVDVLDVFKKVVDVVQLAGQPEVARKLSSGIEAIEKRIADSQSEDNLIVGLLCNIAFDQIAPGAPDHIEDTFRFLIKYAKELYPADDTRPSRYMQGLGDQLRNDKKFEDAKYVLSEALSNRRDYYAAGRIDGLIVAETANSLGLCYRGLGRFEEAEAYLMEALSLRKEQVNDHAPLVAGSLNNLAELFRDKGNIGQSIMFHESAIATFESSLGADHPSTVNARGNLGITLSHNARMGTEVGLNLVQHAMNYLEDNNFAEDHPWVLKFKTELLICEAEKYVRKEEFDDALDIYEKVLQANPFCKESDMSVVIRRQNWQAKYRKAERLRDEARYEESKALFKECMADSLNHYDPNDPVMCEITFAQAENLRLKGEADEAKELYEVLLKIRSTNMGEGHPLCARLMNALAVCSMEAEKYAESKLLFEQALTTITGVHGKAYDEFADEKFCALLEAQILADFSELNRRQSNYCPAYEQVEQALKMRQLWLDENTLLVAQSRFQRAAVLFDIGCIVDAEMSNDLALNVYRHRFDNDFHPLIASALGLKCEIDIQNGKYVHAKETALLVKKIAEDAFFENHTAVVYSLYLNGLATHAAGKYRQTEKIFKDAIYRSKKMFGQYSVMSARSSCASAEAHMIIGNFREASTLFREALAIQERIIGKHHPQYLETLTGLAKHLHHTGSYTDSMSYFNTVKSLLEERDIKMAADTTDIETHRVDMQNLKIDIPVRSAYMLARAELHNTMGEFDKATELYSAAVALRKKMHGSTKHPAVVEALHFQAENWRSRGQNTRKLGVIYDENLQNLLTLFDNDHPVVVRSRQALNDYLVAYETPSQPDDKILTRCRADLIDCCYVVGRCEGAKSLRYASVCSSIGMVLLREGRFDESKEYFEDALRIKETCLGKENAEVADTLNQMTILCIEQELWEMAETFCVRALEMYKYAFGLDHPKTINCHGNLGLIMISAEHTLTAGLKNITEALETLLENKYSSQHPWVIKFRNGQEYVKRIVSGQSGDDTIADDLGSETMSQLEGSLNSVEKDIVELELMLVEKDALIMSMETSYASLEKQYKDLCNDGDVRGPTEEDGRVNDLEAKLKEYESTIASLETKLMTAVGSNMDNVDSRVQELQAKIEEYRTTIAVLEDKAVGAQSETSAFAEKMKELETQVAEHKTALASMELIVSESNRDCDTLRSQLETAVEDASVTSSSLAESLRTEIRLRDMIKGLEAARANQVSPASGDAKLTDSAYYDEDMIYELKEQVARLKRLQSKCQCGQSSTGDTETRKQLESKLTEIEAAQSEQAGLLADSKEVIVKLTQRLSQCKCGDPPAASESCDAATLRHLEDKIAALESERNKYLLEIQKLTDEKVNLTDELVKLKGQSPRAVYNVTDDVHDVLSLSAAAMKDVSNLHVQLKITEAQAENFKSETAALKAELENLKGNESLLKADKDHLEFELLELRSDSRLRAANDDSTVHDCDNSDLEAKLNETEALAAQLAADNKVMKAELDMLMSTAAAEIQLPEVEGSRDDDVTDLLAVAAAAMKDVQSLEAKLKEVEADSSRVSSENKILSAELSILKAASRDTSIVGDMDSEELVTRLRYDNDQLMSELEALKSTAAAENQPTPVNCGCDDDVAGMMAVSVTALRDVDALDTKLKDAEAKIIEVVTANEDLTKQMEKLKATKQSAYVSESATNSDEVDALRAQLQESGALAAQLAADNKVIKAELDMLMSAAAESHPLVVEGGRDDDGAGVSVAVSTSALEDVQDLETRLKAAEAQAAKLKTDNEQLQVELDLSRMPDTGLKAAAPVPETDTVDNCAAMEALLKDLQGQVAQLTSDKIELRTKLEALRWNQSPPPDVAADENSVHISALNVLEGKVMDAEAQLDEMKSENGRLMAELNVRKASPGSSDPVESAEGADLVGIKGLLQDRETDLAQKEAEICALQESIKRLEEDSLKTKQQLEQLTSAAAGGSDDAQKAMDLAQQLAEVRAKKSSLEMELNDSAAEITQLQENITALSAEKSAISVDLSAANSAVADLKGKLEAEVSAAQQSALLLESSRQDFEEALREKDAHILSMVSAKELEAVTDKYTEASVSLERAQRNLNNVKGQLDMKSEENKGLTICVGDLENKVSVVTRAIEKLQADHALCDERIAELEKQVEADKELQHQYEEANASVLDDLNSLQQQALEDKGVIAKLRAELDGLEQKSADMDECRSTIAELETALDAKKAELEDIEYQLRTVEEDLVDVTTENKDKNSKIDYLNRSIEGLNAEAKLFEKRIAATEAKNGALESDKVTLGDRVRELEEIEQGLKLKIEYAKSQKQAFDPWGFGKEAELGFRRFKMESRNRATSSQGTNSLDGRPFASGILALNSTGNISEPDIDSAMCEDEEAAADLSKNVDEMLKGSVPSKHFVAAKGIVASGELDAGLPDINQRHTFAQYVAVTAGTPVVGPVSTTVLDLSPFPDEKEPGTLPCRGMKKSNSSNNGSVEGAGDGFRLFFSHENSRCPSADEDTARDDPVIRSAKSDDSGQSAATKTGPTDFSHTAPGPKGSDMNVTSNRRRPTTDRRAQKKINLSPVKLKGRPAVYGCINTERDLFVTTSKQQKSSLQHQSPGGLDVPSVGQDSSPTHRLSKKLRSERSWDSRFQKSPFDPRSSPDMWPAEGDEDGYDHVFDGSESICDQDSTVTTMKRKELGLY